jgi:glycosyltransferase involved in cell wall biosynthesis
MQQQQRAERWLARPWEVTTEPQDGAVVAVIPAYNEERFIGSVVLRARQYADTVIVVDDGSTDATGEIAAAAGVIVVRHESNRGKGAALNTGFHRARALGAAAVVTLDGDGQHRGDELAVLAEPVLSGQADIVVGSRFLGSRATSLAGAFLASTPSPWPPT